jgi:hypothetical protein
MMYSLDVLSNETVIAQVTCPGKTITDFVTSSPMGLRKSAIMNPSPGNPRAVSNLPRISWIFRSFHHRSFMDAYG